MEIIMNDTDKLDMTGVGNALVAALEKAWGTKIIVSICRRERTMTDVEVDCEIFEADTVETLLDRLSVELRAALVDFVGSGRYAVSGDAEAMRLFFKQ